MCLYPISPKKWVWYQKNAIRYRSITHIYLYKYNKQSTIEQVEGYILLRGPLYIHRNHFLNIQAEGFLPVSFFPFFFISSKSNNGGPDAVYQADKTIISHAIPPPDLETITY